MNTLYLVRHSLTEALERRVYYGKTDLPLSENGKELCRTLRGQLPLPEKAAYGTSGMIRAEETLSLLIGDVPHEVFPALREMNVGIFEMRSYDELKDLEEYQRWLSDASGSFQIPDGESNLTFGRRVTGCLDNLIAERDGDMLIVCHGGVIGCAMHYLFPENPNTFFDWIPKACHGYAIRFRDGKTESWSEI